MRHHWILVLTTILFSALFCRGDYLGSWEIDDYLPIAAKCHQWSTGNAYNASAITYRIYEDETTTEIVTDTSMTNTDGVTGFYLNREQLTAAKGFEQGKCYTVLIQATVDSVSGILAHTFQIVADVNGPATVSASDLSGIANAVWEEPVATHTTETTFGGEVGGLDPNLALVLADTSEMQGDLVNGGRLDLIFDATLADTAEIQTELADGGRTDLILDATLADTDEMQQELADGGRTDLILDATLADTNELQTDWTNGGRLDLILDAIKVMTDLIAVTSTTVATVTDANEFTLTAGQDVNDAYWMHAIMVQDATDSHSEVRWIEEYSTGRSVLVDEPFSFTPAAADKAWILGPVYGGFLYDIANRLDESQAPVYYMDKTGSGASGGAGGTSYYQSDGSDP